MKGYDTVIVGSGYFAWGYAATHANTLILEETQLADRHFGGCLRGFSRKGFMPQSTEAAALFEHARALGLVTDDRLCVTGMEAALCDFFAGRFPDILLGTACMEITREDGLYTLSICNNEGLDTVTARRVIDTRVSGGDRLNVLVRAGQGGLPDTEHCTAAFYEGQGVVSLHMPEAADINRAKVLAYSILEKRLKSVGAQVLGMSYRMYHGTAAAPFTDADGILHIDETYYGDPFAAFEKGETYYDDAFFA